MMFAAAIAIASVTQAEPPSPPAYRYVEVPKVKEGSTLFAYMDPSRGGHVPVASDLFAFSDMIQAILAGDQTGLDEMKASGRLFTLATGTAVRVLEYHEAVIMKSPAYEVRVLDGKHAGKKGWAAPNWLYARVEVPQKAAKGKPAKPVAPPSPEQRERARAATLIRMGRNVEKSNPASAAKYYREVVEKHADTPEAAEAAKRLKAMAPAG